MTWNASETMCRHSAHQVLSKLLPIGLLGACAVVAPNASAASFIGPLNTIGQIASTVPANGDQNPYGVAVVPRSTGKLIQGRVLVSNFNNNGPNGGQQGTGTTIAQIAPNGEVQLFAEIKAEGLTGPCPGGVGLTTALVGLRSGWVIVGSLPTADGTAATAKAGCLIVLNSSGQAVGTLSGGAINGPWDMTALDLGGSAVLFATNVLDGTVAANGAVVHNGNVLRILLRIPESEGEGEDREGLPREMARTVVASGFGQRTDPAALVIGPTGVGLGAGGTLYVADTLANRIAAIPDALFRTGSAGAGQTVTEGGGLN